TAGKRREHLVIRTARGGRRVGDHHAERACRGREEAAQALATQELERILAHAARGEYREIVAARREARAAAIEEIGEAALVADGELAVERGRAKVRVDQQRALAHGREYPRELGGERAASVLRAGTDHRQEAAPAVEPV